MVGDKSIITVYVYSIFISLLSLMFVLKESQQIITILSLSKSQFFIVWNSCCQATQSFPELPAHATWDLFKFYVMAFVEDSIPTTPLMALNKILPHNMHSSDLFSSGMRNQKETSLLKKMTHLANKWCKGPFNFWGRGDGAGGIFFWRGGGHAKKNGYRGVHPKKIKVKRGVTWNILLKLWNTIMF